MKVDEAKDLCKGHSNWKEVIFAYPYGIQALRYVCKNLKLYEIYSLNFDSSLRARVPFDV
jgi:hypothetical protein